ncbi:hypothetical protein EVAR_6010_1 [Eumeta japonica]|uniref:Uncharacterized protein n=1 Tax=Eumeta variegata TaxID=151549 RepID=A0A4C1TAK9_EUMVA|nr:hypothetical protein EVAR_6010_1 [Eumeta japonica]
MFNSTIPPASMAGDRGSEPSDLALSSRPGVRASTGFSSQTRKRMLFCELNAGLPDTIEIGCVRWVKLKIDALTGTKVSNRPIGSF